MTSRERATSLAGVERSLVAIARRPLVQQIHEALNARAGTDLDRPRYSTLSVLVDSGGQRVSHLARACGVEVSTMSRVVDQLIGEGLASASRGVKDRRVQIVEATSKGTRLLNELRRLRRQTLADALSGWHDADLHEFSALLSRFVSDLSRAITTGSDIDSSF